MKTTPMNIALILLAGIIISVTGLYGQAPPRMADPRISDLPRQFLPLYRWGYAGKYAPRIGGSGETVDDKVRLDVGGTLALFEYGRSIRYSEVCSHEPVCDNDNSSSYVSDVWRPFAIHASLGVDFFLWSRLRSEANFKFPVETADYYFGFYVTGRIGKTGDGFYESDPRRVDRLEKRRTTFIPTLRVAHISAHLVDGDPQFELPNDGPTVYSREFFDLSCAMEHLMWIGPNSDGVNARMPRMVYLRPYVGTQLLFHTIPDDLGIVTPYIGGDLEMELLPTSSVPVLRAGYEFRLNTETETIGEHSIRAGIKLAPHHHTGVLLEAAYYSGRSQFGQFFRNREEYFTFGFGFGM